MSYIACFHERREIVKCAVRCITSFAIHNSVNVITVKYEAIKKASEIHPRYEHDGRREALETKGYGIQINMCLSKLPSSIYKLLRSLSVYQLVWNRFMTDMFYVFNLTQESEEKRTSQHVV